MPMSSNPLDLTDKIVLVTGGGQGIGEATAQLCAERGAAVVIADFNREKGEHAAARICQEHGKADFFATDVRDADQVEALTDFVQRKHGRLDKLVCAAGVLRGPWLQPEELALKEFEFTMDVNVKGVFLCAKFATPLLVASGQGVVVIVASGAGVTGPSSSLAYGASKGGVNGFGMTLASQLSERGVRVNVICPGNIVTEMKLSVEVAAAQRSGAPVEEALEKAHRNYGTPEGVARIIAFMISDEADYLRGNLFTR
jgi:NAD(P)-dependent dehydrogenase (short-subunit alcohol dehydrogenase family)